MHHVAGLTPTLRTGMKMDDFCPFTQLAFLYVAHQQLLLTASTIAYVMYNCHQPLPKNQ